MQKVNKLPEIDQTARKRMERMMPGVEENYFLKTRLRKIKAVDTRCVLML